MQLTGCKSNLVAGCCCSSMYGRVVGACMCDWSASCVTVYRVDHSSFCFCSAKKINGLLCSFRFSSFLSSVGAHFGHLALQLHASSSAISQGLKTPCCACLVRTIYAPASTTETKDTQRHAGTHAAIPSPSTQHHQHHSPCGLSPTWCRGSIAIRRKQCHLPPLHARHGRRACLRRMHRHGRRGLG